MAAMAMAQTPPYFTPSTHASLPATFDVKSTHPYLFVVGGVFAVNATQHEPKLFLPVNTSMAAGADTPKPNTSDPHPSTFVVLMVDPDAPSPQDTSRAQILHWLQPGVRLSRSIAPIVGPNGSLLSLLSERDTQTAPITPYIGPAPPSIGPHRYILLLFRQPEAIFRLPPGWEGFAGGANRTHFDAAAFACAAALGEPIAATFFLAGNETTGYGSETYRGDDAAAGIGGNTSYPMTATAPTTGVSTPTLIASVQMGKSSAVRIGIGAVTMAVVAAVKVFG